MQRVNVEALTKTITAGQQPVWHEGDDLVLGYAISGQRVALTFSPALPLALFDQNTDKLLLSCPAPVAILSSIPGFSATLVGLKMALRIRADLFGSTTTVDVPGKVISLKIPSQEIVMDTQGDKTVRRVVLHPEWGQNALMFSAKLTK